MFPSGPMRAIGMPLDRVQNPQRLLWIGNLPANDLLDPGDDGPNHPGRPLDREIPIRVNGLVLWVTVR
jgi:hypothetical protein